MHRWLWPDRDRANAHTRAPAKLAHLHLLSCGDAHKLRLRDRQQACDLAEAGAHNGTVVFGQAAYQFVIEIIAACGRSIAITLPVGRTALLDVVLQAVIYIFVLASFGDFGLVV